LHSIAYVKISYTTPPSAFVTHGFDHKFAWDNAKR